MTMTKMMTTLRSTISPFAVVQLLLLVLLGVSKSAFLSAEVAYVSAYVILLGSMYSYSRLVRRNLENGSAMHLDDPIEKIDDPYDLYSEEIQAEEEERPLKEVIKEEKARLKAGRATVKHTSKSAPALFSLYRVIPYAVLVLGFIALKNNGLLALWYFLPGLAAGIVAGYFSGKALFAADVSTD
jgi:hypothetical protein